MCESPEINDLEWPDSVAIPIKRNYPETEGARNNDINENYMWHDPEQPAKTDIECPFTETTLISFASQIANGMVCAKELVC